MRRVLRLLGPDEKGALVVPNRIVEAPNPGRSQPGGGGILAGVALATKVPPLGLGEELSYLVFPVESVSEAAVENAGVRRVRIYRSFAARGLPGLSSALKSLGTSTADRNLFGLMFYQWVADARPIHYLSGEDLLHEAFFADLFCAATGRPSLPFSLVLDLLAEQKPGSSARMLRLEIQAMFATAFGHAANRVADVELRSADLPGLKAGEDIFIGWCLIFAGVLSGATEIALLALALDAVVVYLQLLHDEHIAERDGEITDDEVLSTGMGLAMGIFFLPVSPAILPGMKPGRLDAFAEVLAKCADSAQRRAFQAFVAIFLVALADRLRRLVEYRERLQVAREAGLSDYLEIDLDRTIVLPLAALRVRVP